MSCIGTYWQTTLRGTPTVYRIDSIVDSNSKPCKYGAVTASYISVRVTRANISNLTMYNLAPGTNLMYDRWMVLSDGKTSTMRLLTVPGLPPRLAPMRSNKVLLPVDPSVGIVSIPPGWTPGAPVY